MINLDYGAILKKAWKTIWKYKILWIFGILASCSAGSSGSSFNFGNRFSGGGNNNNFNYSGDNSNMPPQMRQFMEQLGSWFSPQNMNQTFLVIGLVVLILVLLALVLRLILAAIGTIGQVGLINGAWQVEEGSGKLSFSALLKDGWKSFWRVILFKIIYFIFRILLALVTIVLIIVTCCLFLSVDLVLTFVIWIMLQLTMVAMVGENLGIAEAISKAWQLFKKNWVTTSIMALILGVIDFVYTLILIIPLILILLPAGIGFYMSASSQNYANIIPYLIVSGVLLLFYIVVAIFLGGVKQAYLSVGWTLIYRQLAGFQLNEGHTLPPVVLENNPPVDAG